MTAFRRRLRYHQAQWREANGHPIGSQPIVPRAGAKPSRLVGSRLPLDYARETGANFLTARRARGSACARVARRSRIRASITSDCGPTSCRRRRWPSTSSATSPPTSTPPTGPSTPGGRTRRAPSAKSASRTRPAGSIPRTSTACARSTPRSCSTSVAGAAGSSPSTSSTTSGASRRPPEAGERPRATSRSRSDRARSRRERPPRLEGRSELAVMWLEHLLLLSMLQHASRRVDVGPLRRRPPGGQRRHRRSLRSLPKPPRRRLDVRIGDARGASWPPARFDRARPLPSAIAICRPKSCFVAMP